MKDVEMKDMKKKDLINEYKAQVELIEDIGCYAVGDVMYRDRLEEEIIKRGYKIKRSVLVEVIE